VGYKYNFPSTNSTYIKQNMIAEVQIGINQLPIDDIQDAKYEMAKYINKIITKHTEKQPKKNTKTKTLKEYKKKT
jgi:hypothetical protein